MRKIMAIAIAVLALGVLSARPAQSLVLLDWTIELESKTVDAARSAADLGGFDDWVIWTYRVTANTNTGTSSGEFTHLGIGIPHGSQAWVAAAMYISDGIEDSMLVMDAGGSDVTSDYINVMFRESGGPIGTSAPQMEWNNEGDLVITTGDFNLFSFSTPSVATALVDLGIKQGGTRAYGRIEGPGALGAGVPEPGLLGLLGFGLAGMGILRRRRRTS